MDNFPAENMFDKKKGKQLLKCIKDSDIDQVRALLQTNLDLNTMINKELPLVRAARVGVVEMVEMLLNAGADPDKCETVYDNYGGLYINRCALLECPFLGEKGVKIAKILFDHKADINILDDEGYSVLENAVIHGHTELMDVLFEHGASVNEVGASGDMPLHHACMDGDVKIADYLIKKGADINPTNTHSPILIAADRGHLNMVEFLLSKGADPNQVDSRGQTPFLQACYRGNLDIVKILLNGGANIKTCNTNGDTCVHFLCYQYPNKKLLKYLIEQGADLYAKNSEGKTAFSMVCLLARTDAVVALLGAGFDVQTEEDAHPGICLQIISMLPSIRKRTHPKKVNQMAELLVAMGYNIPKVSSMKEIRRMLGSASTTSEICDWLVEQKTNAKPLKNITRLNIRDLLGLTLNIDEKIDSLPLPEKIKEFLKFEELIKQEKKERCLGCNEYMDECECQTEDYEFHDDYEVDWGSDDFGGASD